MAANPFGALTRPWARRTLAKLLTDTDVLAPGEIIRDDVGGLYLPDGVTQSKNLSPVLTSSAATAVYGPGSTLWLKTFGLNFSFSFISVTATNAATGLVTAATVRWPDGTGGVFTGTVDGGGNGYTFYSVTWTGTTLKTFSASGISYDPSGNQLGPTTVAVS